MTRLDPVLSTIDLPLAELCAARLDGELYTVDECFSPVDVAQGAEDRARSLGILWPDRLIAELTSAAWIWGAVPAPPAVHQLCANAGARVRPRSTTLRVALREVIIDRRDYVTIAGLGVTTPLRTVVDMARFAEPYGPAEHEAMLALAAIGGFGLAEAARSITSRRNLPGARSALERLERALSPS